MTNLKQSKHENLMYVQNNKLKTNMTMNNK